MERNVWLYIFVLGSFCFASLNGLLDVQVSKSSCPSVLNCFCIEGDVRNIQCYGVGQEKLYELERVYGRNIERLEFTNWQESSIDFDNFTRFPKLQTIQILSSEIEHVSINRTLDSLQTLILENDELENDDMICGLVDMLPNLSYLSLANNYLTEFNCPNLSAKVKNLKLRRNEISMLDLPDSIDILDISSNSLTSIQNISRNFVDLDLSNNQISSWEEDLEFPELKRFMVSGLKFKEGFELNAPKLEEFNMDESELRFLNFYKIKAGNIRNFSAAKSRDLQVVAGKAPDNLKNLTLTETQLLSMPSGFFNKKKVEFKFSSSKLQCQPCILRWTLPVFEELEVQKLCGLTRKDITSANCTIGIANMSDVFGKYSDDTILECLYFGDPTPQITWYRYRPSQLLGKYNPIDNSVDYTNVSGLARESYSINDGGHLLIRNPNRSHVERYVCVAENEHGKVHQIMHFRLDYSDWYSFNVFHSVFWGGLATSLFVCFISFLLNITWILTRKSALWWIQRAERLSRVRKMVEAMEKYRVRQMESLHEKYTKRVQIVRDNYHQQVEALRVSYSSQSEKFRDYRAAQMETVSSHLESMRDNYNTQLARVREYGAKRADALWDSYEKQVNRMRTFSLQHRLKMMRQYKVKQRYLNKLLESFQASTPEQRLEHEEQVRAALDIPNDLVDIDAAGASRLSRSSSFHSLPEYLIDERGNMQPGIPPASQTIRFSNIVAFPTTSTTTTTSPSSSTPLKQMSPDQPSTSSSSKP